MTDRNVNSIVFGFSIALLVLLVFGMTCLISRFVSVQQGDNASVFGMSVMSVSDNSNADNFAKGTKVVAHKASFDEIKIGDYVIFGNVNDCNLNYSNFGKVELLTEDALIVHQTNTNMHQAILKDELIAKCGSTSTLACGIVSFLLSGWLLWLFVIIPVFVLICILLFILKSHLYSNKEEVATEKRLLCAPKQLLLAQYSVVNEVIKEAKAKKKKAKAKPAKKGIVEEIDGSRQLFMDFSAPQEESIDVVKPKKIRQKNPKKEEKTPQKITNDVVLSITKEPEPEPQKTQPKPKQKKQEYVIQKPRAKRKGDDYVFEKLPTMDTQTPIKILLNKFSKEKEINPRSELLEKMKNSSRR